jgi:hypothetical protein
MLEFENYLAVVGREDELLAADKLKLFGNTLKGFKRSVTRNSTSRLTDPGFSDRTRDRLQGHCRPAASGISRLRGHPMHAGHGSV